MTVAKGQRFTTREGIVGALVLAKRMREPLHVELLNGATFPTAYVNAIGEGNRTVHFGTKGTTHAIVTMRSIVAVTG